MLIFPKISQKRSSTLNDLLQATMLRIRETNRTIVGYVRCARFPQMQAIASLFTCGQPKGSPPRIQKQPRLRLFFVNDEQKGASF